MSNELASNFFRLQPETAVNSINNFFLYCCNIQLKNIDNIDIWVLGLEDSGCKHEYGKNSIKRWLFNKDFSQITTEYRSIFHL